MKKMLLVLLSGLMFCGANAQSFGNYVTEQQTKFRGYTGVGAGLSGGLATYSVEAGVWNNKVWVSGVAEFTPLPHSNAVATYGKDHTVTFIGPKFYRKVGTYQKFDAFLYGAAKVGVSETSYPLQFEPGACLIYNLTEHIAFQWSTSRPIYEGASYPAPYTTTSQLNTGLCVNWFF